MKSLMENREEIIDRLKGNAYSDVALAPGCNWIPAKPIEISTVKIERDALGGFQIRWNAVNPNEVRRWTVSVLYESTWQTKVVGHSETSYQAHVEKGVAPRAVVISGINGAGEIGEPRMQMLE